MVNPASPVAFRFNYLQMPDTFILRILLFMEHFLNGSMPNQVLPVFSWGLHCISWGCLKNYLPDNSCANRVAVHRRVSASLHSSLYFSRFRVPICPKMTIKLSAYGSFSLTIDQFLGPCKFPSSPSNREYNVCLPLSTMPRSTSSAQNPIAKLQAFSEPPSTWARKWAGQQNLEPNQPANLHHRSHFCKTDSGILCHGPKYQWFFGR